MTTTERPGWKAVYESGRAQAYDAFIEAAAMNYRGALEAVLTMAGRTPRPVSRILDLGAGTGRLTELALERFPRARAQAVDGSQAMLERARARLAPYGERVSLSCRSFESLLDGLDGGFDLIVSSFALHHLDHGDMRKLLQRLRAALLPEGQLVVADYVLSPSSRLQGWYEESWVEHRLAGQEDRSPAAKRRMMEEHQRTKEAEGDNPAVLEDLLAWTREAGFRDAGCHWRYYCYAVYGGLA